LPVPYREVLLLCEFEEMSYQEISATLVIPIGTVMSRLSRARRALRTPCKNCRDRTGSLESWPAKLGVENSTRTSTVSSPATRCSQCSNTCGMRRLRRRGLAKVQQKLAVKTRGRSSLQTQHSALALKKHRVAPAILDPLFIRSRGKAGWLPVFEIATVAVVLLIGVALFLTLHRGRDEQQLMSELVDQHVATLASSNPVDVVSTDRHTVKPWFEGKIPFTFNLPELQGSSFLLVGGRVSYLSQAPGAELIFRVRQHQISVFIFQERGPAGTHEDAGENAAVRTAFPLKSAAGATTVFAISYWRCQSPGLGQTQRTD